MPAAAFVDSSENVSASQEEAHRQVTVMGNAAVKAAEAASPEQLQLPAVPESLRINHNPERCVPCASARVCLRKLAATDSCDAWQGVCGSSRGRWRNATVRGRCH